MRYSAYGREHMIAARIALMSMMFVAPTGCWGRTPTAPPARPTLTPAESQIDTAPGKEVTLQAYAEGAVRYEWRLQGPGRLSSTIGEVVDYVRRAGETGTATVSVVAYNANGPSAPAEVRIRAAAVAGLRLDAVAIPAGWMVGNGVPGSALSWSPGNDGCRDAAGSTRPGCMRAQYNAGVVFGGIAWWATKCGNSGTPEAWARAKAGSCAVDLLQASGFKEIKRLTFWVRGETGNEGVEFRVGLGDVSPAPGRSMGTQMLRKTWTQFEIDVTGMDMTKVVVPFAWIAADASNPSGATFYLEGIQFEGNR